VKKNNKMNENSPVKKKIDHPIRNYTDKNGK